MKKILIITQHFPPESIGRASRVLELAKFLNKFIKVRVVAPPPSKPPMHFKKAKYLFKKENFEDIDVLRIWTFQPFTNKPNFLQRALYYFIFPFFASFFIIANSKNYSTIILSTLPKSVLLVFYIARLFRKKTVIDVGDLDYDPAVFGVHKTENSILKKIANKFEVDCWKKCDVIMTNQKTIQNLIRKKIGNNNLNKVVFFPYIVDLDRFKRNIVKREKQIVYLGTYSPLQNLSPIIQAMPLILKKIPDVKLLFYGSGSIEKELKKLVIELHLEQSCEIKGRVPREEIPMILSRSMIGITGIAMNESARAMRPTKIFEYFACSLPVFAYGFSGDLKILLEESGGGIFVDSDDPKIIANDLITMINDERNLENYSKNGRKFVENQTDYSEIVKMM